MMPVGWRERDWAQLRDVVAIEEPDVRATLATCGLLKFFECPLIWAQEYLLQFLIQMWSLELHCFLMRGEKIPFTVVEDVYFLTGLPFRETPLPAEPVLPRGTFLADVGRRYCSGQNFMSGMVVSISIDRFPSASLYSSDDCTGHWRTQADQWWPASGVGESVGRRAIQLGDDTACMDGGAVGPLSVYWCRGVFFRVHPSGLVSREGVDVAPKDPIECAWGTRATGEGGHFFSVEEA
jgi:hypothetical protein